MRLADLPDRPRFIFNAAHLATGVSWRFSKPYMGDSRLGVVCDPELPLARAVSASAAFPPFVAPLLVDLRGRILRQTEGADLFDVPRYHDLRDRVLLLDGGAYDNLGIEPVEGRCRIVLVSDAGGNLSVDARRTPYRFWWPLLRRTLDMAVESGTSAATARAHRPSDCGSQPARWRPGTPAPCGPSMLPSGGLRSTSEAIGSYRMAGSCAQGWNDYLSTRPTRLGPCPRQIANAS